MSVSGGDDRAARLQRAIAVKRGAASGRGPRIPVRPPGEVPYLGDLQRGLWVVHQMDPASPAYNLCSAFRLHGSIDLSRLQQGLDAAAGRHRLLRSTFCADGERVRQVVHPRIHIPIEQLSAGPGDARETARREAARPFDLERGPLARAALIEEEGSGDRVLLLVLHHIIADERALEALWRELSVAYDAGVTAIEETAAQYDDYVHWLRESGDAQRHADLEFWRARLQSLPDELRLPFERTASREPAAPTGRLIVRRPAAGVRTGLRRLAEDLGITPFMAAAFTFRLLLHRYTDGQRIAFGTPVSARAHPAALEMLGYFLNPLVVSTEIAEQQPVRAAMASFAADVTATFAHATLPFDRLAAELVTSRQDDRQPLFQVMFVYQETGPAPALGRAQLEPVSLDLGASKFDLTLFVTERTGTLETGIEYRADKFEEEPLRAMLVHYETLIEGLARDPDAPLAAVPTLAPAERAQVSVWESGPPLTVEPGATVTAELLRQARRQPGALAVVAGGHRADYATLVASSGAIACALQADGVNRGDRVAIFIDRSLPLIAALVGTHLAGAAYVPLDPGYPETRNRDVLDDAEVAAVLTTAGLRGRLPAGPWPIITVDRLDTPDPGAATVLPAITSDLHAYILYTSGSTGRPKGVVISHDNLWRSTAARFQYYAEPPERFLLLPSIAFDSSVAGIFWTLTAGGTLIVPSDEDARDARLLRELIARERVTSLLCVPSLYAELLAGGDAPLRSLRTVIVAGEHCSSRLVADHAATLPGVRLFNEYGPTEGTVWATVHEMTSEDAMRAVSIGRPIPGVRLEVRDRLGRQLPAWIPGAATIVGPTVAEGYWRRPEQTDQRFAQIGPRADSALRRYRTGDRMAWTPDGRLLFLGRDDEQVKVRGFRIEPGEIEAALVELLPLEEAAVVSRQPGAASGTPALIAFVVRRNGHELHDWRTALATRLPSHMIPARLVELPELPRLPNGKVDRPRLREVPIADDRSRVSAEPSSPREQSLLSLWQGLLGRYDFTVTDNFFELGGHSLLVIQMVAAIERDLEVRLAAAEVFQHPTVRSLAERIERRDGATPFTYQQLFPIQPFGARAPFVMASPDFFTEALAARFRGERPVYGVRGVSLRAEGNRGRWPTLTALAEDVARELTRRFPEGPYVVAGYSFGGWLAIETVRVLELQGLRVQRLYVIAPMPLDFVRAGPFRVRLDGLRQPVSDLGAADVLRQFLRSNHPLTRGPYRRTRQLLFERPWRRTLSLLGARGRRRGLPLTPRQVQADARAERYRLYAAHRPGPVQAPTVFFNPVGPASDAAATWRPYFTGPLTIHAIPDPHDEASVGAAREIVLRHLQDPGD